MPCYFVSSGVEIPMTNQTFDLIWNGFGNKDLIDSETSIFIGRKLQSKLIR